MAKELMIEVADPSSAEMLGLLNRHLDLMRAVTPPESIHALNLDGLMVPEVTVWVALQGGRPVGCGALRELDPIHGEIKFMHTLEERRGRGTGRAVLLHILEEARTRAYHRLSLETGSFDAFAAARSLYLAHGFVPCGPFGPYEDDPNLAFMTLEL